MVTRMILPVRCRLCVSVRWWLAGLGFFLVCLAWARAETAPGGRAVPGVQGTGRDTAELQAGPLAGPGPLRGRLPAAGALAELVEGIESKNFPSIKWAFRPTSPHAPSEAASLVEHALKELQHGAYDDAIQTLERAVRLDAQVNEAHRLLGELYAQRDELPTAIRHYERAAQQDPNNITIQDRLFTTRRQYQLEAHLHRIVSPHFIVKFEPSHHALAGHVAERLERLYQTLGRKLASFPDEKVIVVLYGEQAFERAVSSPEWAAGFFDGRMHVAGSRISGSQSRDATLAHEYMHVLVSRLSGGHAPTWLAEGLALAFEGDKRVNASGLPAPGPDELIPLHALHGSFLDLPLPMARIAYAESYSATAMLIQRFGLNRVRQLVAALAAEPNFARAFEQVFQHPYREFEAEWLAAQTDRRL